MPKNFILDTNVLLHDPRSIYSFTDNNVIIPIYVIEEIDQFKRDLSELGRNARLVTRYLDSFRTEGSLKQALSDIEGLKERYRNVSVQDKGKRFNTDLLEAIELGFLLDLAEVLVTSALARNESRGGHFREDYATRDDVNFMRHTMAYRNDDGSIRLDYKPVIETRYKPMERKY